MKSPFDNGAMLDQLEVNTDYQALMKGTSRISTIKSLQ